MRCEWVHMLCKIAVSGLKIEKVQAEYSPFDILIWISEYTRDHYCWNYEYLVKGSSTCPNQVNQIVLLDSLFWITWVVFVLVSWLAFPTAHYKSNKKTCHECKSSEMSSFLEQPPSAVLRMLIITTHWHSSGAWIQFKYISIWKLWQNISFTECSPFLPSWKY